MTGFNWLKSKIDSAIAHPSPAEQPPAPADTLEQKILNQCQQPTTLGELADLTKLTYRQLRPVIQQMISDGRLKLTLAPVGEINAIHYQTTKL